MVDQGTRDRVLIIDDDIMSREVLTFLLEDAEFAIDSVESGESALEHLQNGTLQPTVVLTDVQLPGLAGAALAGALRSACPRGTILIAMSGSEPPEDVVEAFDRFLLKPFGPPELMAALAKVRANLDVQTDYNNWGIDSHQGGTDSEAATPSGDASKTGMRVQTYQEQSGLTHPLPASVPMYPALDETIYSQLADTMNGPQLREMYDLCLKDVRKRIAGLRSLAAARQGEPFVRQAHAIKGGCGMLGASELYQRAAALEKSGLKAAGLAGGSGVNPLDELTAACDRLERILSTRT